MCRNCVMKYGGHEVVPTPEMLSWAEEIRAFYERPDCGAGGPLHVVLDDYNIEDEFLEPWDGKSHMGNIEIDPETTFLAKQICDALRKMTLPQRAYTIAFAHNHGDLP